MQVCFMPTVRSVYSRRHDRKQISTFPFPPIPMKSVPIPSLPIAKFKSYPHSHRIPVGLFPFLSHSQTRTAEQSIMQTVDSQATEK